MELTRQAESPLVPKPNAGPPGARLDSALARQTQAKKAVEAADKMLMVAHQKTKETMTEMQQANIAVEVVKRKVGPATGLASGGHDAAGATEGESRVKVVRV